MSSNDKEDTKRRNSKVVKEKNLKPSNVINASLSFNRMKIYLDFMSKITTTRRNEQLTKIVTHELSKVLDCDRSTIFFVDGENLQLLEGKGLQEGKEDEEDKDPVVFTFPKTSGFAGKCATQGVILNIPDAYKDKSGVFNDSFDKKTNYRTRSVLCAPIRDQSNNEVIGVLQSINKSGNKPFDQVDQHLFVSIANQVGINLSFSLEKERIKEKFYFQRRALMEYINSMSQNVPTVTSVLYDLTKAAKHVCGADKCSFYVVDREDWTLSLISTDSNIDVTIEIGKGLAGTVALNGQIINIENAYNDNRFDRTWDKKSGYKTKCMIVMPVFAEKSVSNNIASFQRSDSRKRIIEMVDKSIIKSKNHHLNNYNTPKKVKKLNKLSPISDNKQDNVNFDLPPLRNDNSRNSQKRRDSILSSQKPKFPIAVVQLINKKDNMLNGKFTKEDQDLLDLLVRFVAPIVKNSKLFQKRQKSKNTPEGLATQDVDISAFKNRFKSNKDTNTSSSSGTNLTTDHVKQSSRNHLKSQPSVSTIMEGNENENEKSNNNNNNINVDVNNITDDDEEFEIDPTI